MKQEHLEKNSPQNSEPSKNLHLCDETVRQLRGKKVLKMYREIFSEEKETSKKGVSSFFNLKNTFIMKKFFLTMGAAAIGMIVLIFGLNLTNPANSSPLEILVAKVQAANQKSPARYHFQKLKTTFYQVDGLKMEKSMEVWTDTESSDYIIIEKNFDNDQVLGVDVVKENISFRYGADGSLVFAQKMPEGFSGRPNGLMNFNEEFAPLLQDLIKGNKDSEALNSFIRSIFFGDRVVTGKENVTETIEYVDGSVSVQEHEQKRNDDVTLTTKYLGISTLNGKKVEGLMTEISQIIEENAFRDKTKKPEPQKTTIKFYFDAETFQIVMAEASFSFNNEIETLEFLNSDYTDQTPIIKIGNKTFGLGPLSEEEKSAPIDAFGGITNGSDVEQVPDQENTEQTLEQQYWESVKTESQRKNNQDGYFLNKGEVRFYTNSQWSTVSADLASFQVSRTSSSYAKDNSFIYFQGKKIEGAKGKSFAVMDGKYSLDEDNVFYGSVPMENAKTDNFSTYDGEYLVNGVAVYYHDKLLEGADPITFRYLGNGMAMDKNGEFELGVRKK